MSFDLSGNSRTVSADFSGSFSQRAAIIESSFNRASIGEGEMGEAGSIGFNFRHRKYRLSAGRTAGVIERGTPSPQALAVYDYAFGEGGPLSGHRLRQDNEYEEVNATEI